MPAAVLPRADLPFPGSLPEFQRLFPDDTACAAVDLVLGGVPRFEPYAGHIGRPIPAPAWLEPLRDGVPDPPQTARRHGPTRPRPDRWPAAGSCRDRRVMGRRQDARRGPRRP